MVAFSLQFVFILFHRCEQVWVCSGFFCGFLGFGFFFLDLWIEEGVSAFTFGQRESLETGGSPLLFSSQLTRNNDPFRRNESGSAGLVL